MKIARAIATDGRIFEERAGGFEVVGKSSHPFFRAGAIGAGNVAGEKLSQPYSQSVWVQRAIKHVADPIAAVPVRFSRQERGSSEVLTDPRLAAFWERPMLGPADKLVGRAEFLLATVGWLKLKGEAFWILDDTWLTTRAVKRSPIMVARPDTMREITRKGELLGWRWQRPDGKSMLLLPEQVIQPKLWNPYDEFRGLSEMSAAHVAAEADYLSNIFARNLARNNGDAGPIIVGKSGMPSDEQQAQITRLLRDKKQRASRGDFVPVFLAGDISVQDPQIKAPDAAFVAQRMENRHEVFVAFGVPPSMAEVMASYSVGSASDRYRLIEDTCAPLANGILADAIEEVSARLLGLPSVFAWFDFSQHSVMRAAQRERIDGAQKLFAMGMPMEQINQFLDLGLPEYEGWDVGYLPFGLSPVDQLAAEDPTTNPDYTEEPPAELPPEDPANKLVRLIGARKQLLLRNTKPVGEEAQQRTKREALWKQHMLQRRPIEKAFAAKINAALTKARAEMLRKIEQSKAIEARALHLGQTVARAAAADLMFDLGGFKKGLVAQMRKVAAQALQTSGEELYQEVGKDDPFTMPSPEALAYLKIRDNRIGDASEEIFGQIKDALQEGIDDGEPTDALADRVRGAFNGISKERARMIAATETQAAYGVGRHRAMETAGIEKKQWLTSGLDSVRASHLEADGQIVNLDDPFDVGSAQLMHPGDPEGPPEEVINCRCVSIAVSASDEE